MKKLTLSMLLFISFNAFSQNHLDIELTKCELAAQKSAEKYMKRNFTSSIDYCQSTVTSLVSREENVLVFELWMRCHIGPAKTVFVETKSYNSWFSGMLECKSHRITAE